MPAPRAYSEAKVIATGFELEKTGPVTPASLHQALGGRGDRYTAWSTWEAFVEQRQHLTSVPAPTENTAYTPAVNGLLGELLKVAAAMASQVKAETAEPLEMRAGHLLHSVDRLLIEREALQAEVRDLRAELASAGKAALDKRDGDQDQQPCRPSLVIFPHPEPRRPPRERLGTWQHRPAPARP